MKIFKYSELVNEVISLRNNIENLYKIQDEDRSYLLKEIGRVSERYDLQYKNNLLREYHNKIDKIEETYSIDDERYHKEYDKLLCNLLMDLEFEVIVSRYKEAQKSFWYE